MKTAIASLVAVLVLSGCVRQDVNTAQVDFHGSPVAHGAYIGQTGDVAIYVFVDNETGATCHIADNVRGYATGISCIPMEPQDD